MTDERTIDTLKTSGGLNPKEPVMIRFVSEATGDTYDPAMVDHLADMLLIFYAGGGTALGAMADASLFAMLFVHSYDMQHILEIVPLGGFAGALLGALIVFLILNLRGLVKWDKSQVFRTYKLKA
jgi:hypothetical protein